MVAWTRVSSFLLALPPVLARDAFLNLDTCSVRHLTSSASDSVALASLVVYVAVVVFFLPACVLAPSFIAWTGLRSRINVGEFEWRDGDDSDSDEDKWEKKDLFRRGNSAPAAVPSVALNGNLLLVPTPSNSTPRSERRPSAVAAAAATPRPSLFAGNLLPSRAINRIHDKDFAGVLFVFAISQVILFTS